jgi:hypothetical protein
METRPIYGDDEWRYVETILPQGLEVSAYQMGALARCRNVPNALALLRMILAYAVSDLSLKDVAAWASSLGIAEITGPGLFYRMRQAEEWLQRVLAQTLEQNVPGAPLEGLRMRIVDATVINGPGATGIEWRAHTIINPVTGRFDAVRLTDRHTGEGYGRHPIKAGDLVLGDRAYATARGIYAVRQADAHVLVRLNPHTLRICDVNRQRVSLLSEAGRVPNVGVLEFNILVPIPPDKLTRSHKSWKLESAVGWVPARVVASRTRTGEVIWVLTTMPEAELASRIVLVLYRLRWQIELLFKRLKSLLHLDTLPSREGPTAMSWMLARFLAAALAQQIVEPSGALSPWGYEIRQSRIHP